MSKVTCLTTRFLHGVWSTPLCMQHRDEQYARLRSNVVLYLNTKLLSQLMYLPQRLCAGGKTPLASQPGTSTRSYCRRPPGIFS